MKKIERVKQVLTGKRPDHAPMGFWLHFPKEIISQGVEAQVAAHLAFKEETLTDILKIMNENEMRSHQKIEHLHEWKNITKITKDSKLVKDQENILQRIVEANEEDCYLLGTVHGLIASLSHASGHSYSVSPQLINEHYQRDPQSVKDGLKIIEENTQLVLEMTMGTGVQGIYYAALGGEKGKFSDTFFQEALKVAECTLLEQANKKEDFSTFLHICKEATELKKYQDYPCDVINWAMHESEYSFEEAKKIFGNKVYLGGFDDRSGVLVEGNVEEIKQELMRIENEFANNRYIIGADCTLPTDISLNKLRQIHEHLSQ
ncbi:uroporphyrinogen decarboxylase family protein [Enterococcus sp. AZ109]|uniref:uroporphyrinogen decarboxylase family protein n=1 Tax=Enterococcus sp. AZ109 TaxID=2774634 RepID=UPI003F221639